MSSPSNKPKTLARVALLTLIGLVLLFSGLGVRSLWDQDEGMHALTSREMLDTGDWITPRFNGEPFYDKPPLFNWLVALSFSVMGLTEFAARLPAALAGLVTVLATYLCGRRLTGERSAFLGAVVLATSLLFVLLSRTVMHDIVLALTVTITLFAFARAWQEERRRGAWLLVAYGAAGFGVLAKGPLGALLPGAVAFLFLVLRRDWAFVRKSIRVPGILLFLAIVVPWYAALGARDPEFLRYFLLAQNLGNFVSAEPTHPEPFWFYLPVLLGGLLPWTWCLPSALAGAVRRARRAEAGPLFLLIWVGFVFVFFSTASSKLPTYILPLFPAAALMLGDLWDRWLGSPREMRRPLLVSGFALQSAVFVAAVFWVRANLPDHPEIAAALSPAAWVVLALAVLVPVALATLFVVARRPLALLATVALGTALMVNLTERVLGPAVDDHGGSRKIGMRLDAMLPPGAPMTMIGRIKDTALFYSGRRGVLVRDPGEVGMLLREGRTPCLVDESRQRQILDRILPPDAYRVLDRQADKMIVRGIGEEAGPQR